jgi:hypothetical protein
MSYRNNQSIISDGNISTLNLHARLLSLDGDWYDVTSVLCYVMRFAFANASVDDRIFFSWFCLQSLMSSSSIWLCKHRIKRYSSLPADKNKVCAVDQISSQSLPPNR